MYFILFYYRKASLTSYKKHIRSFLIYINPIISYCIAKIKTKPQIRRVNHWVIMAVFKLVPTVTLIWRGQQSAITDFCSIYDLNSLLLHSLKRNRTNYINLSPISELSKKMAGSDSHDLIGAHDPEITSDHCSRRLSRGQVV